MSINVTKFPGTVKSENPWCMRSRIEALEQKVDELNSTAFVALLLEENKRLRHENKRLRGKTISDFFKQALKENKEN